MSKNNLISYIFFVLCILIIAEKVVPSQFNFTKGLRFHFERRYLKLTVPTPAMTWAPSVYTLQTYQKKHITMMKRIRSKQPSQPPSFGFPLLSFLGLSPPPQLPPDEPLPPKKASNAMKSPKSSIYFCVTSHHP